MTWPTDPVDTSALDAGTDTPPRATFFSWAQKFNQLIAHVSGYMQGLLASADAAAARTTLDVPSRGGNGASGTWGISINGNAANLSRSVTGAGLASGGGALTADRTITVTAASQAQAEAGTDNATAMTPLRTAQAADKRAIGYGQQWRSPGRSTNTNYQNTQGKPIQVSINGYNGIIYVSTDGSSWVDLANLGTSTNGTTATFIVPPLHWYYVAAGTTVYRWREMY